jgi:hypothetical protein
VGEQQFSLWLCWIATPALAGDAKKFSKKGSDLVIRASKNATFISNAHVKRGTI